MTRATDPSYTLTLNIDLSAMMLRMTKWLFLSGLLASSLPNVATGQLTVLSSGNVNLKWRSTQLELIDQQLSDAQIKGQLRLELEAQKQWLTAWASGSMTSGPLIQHAVVDRMLPEPTIDPSGKAKKHRARLLGTNAKPTVADTQALHEALKENPSDIGLRQLHLHWLDQKQYRKEYAHEIAEAARKLAGMLTEVEPQNEELKLARGYCYYRVARALVYQELPEVVARKPIHNLQTHEAELLGATTQLQELFGKDRPEFILIEIRMLRRDHWYGQALMLLEKYADSIDPQWFLKKRRDLLRDLGWVAPADEAASIYEKNFPDEVALEDKTSDG